MNREETLRHPAYWFENEQNEIYSQVTDYMEREGINQTQLAKKLKVGKSYVSQILKGNYNFSLKKWIELCLAIGIVPAGYKSIEDVIQEDKIFAQSKKSLFEKKTEIESDAEFEVKIIRHPATDKLRNTDKNALIGNYSDYRVAK